MAKLPIKSLPLIGIVLLLSVVGFFLMKSDREDIGEKILDEIVPRADISSEKFNVTLNNSDKGTRWTLEADDFSYSEKANEDDIVQLENFRIKFQQKNGLGLELEGKNGEYNSTKKEITLSGELKGKTSNGYVFYTEHVTVQQKENILKSDGSVTFIGPFFKITGKGLFIDLEKETLKILSDVKSIFDKESLNL